MTKTLAGRASTEERSETERRVYNLQNDEKIWVDYPKAALITDTVKQFCKLPQRAQAPCLVVYGDGGTGKSSLIRQFRNDDVIGKYSVFLAMNDNPQDAKFNELLANALGVPNVPTGYQRTHIIKPELLQVIKLREIRCLIIDELHDAFLGPRTEQLKIMSKLKGLSNDPYGLSIVGFGTNMASNALSIDKQMSRRFHRIELEDWKESEAFRSFLAGLEIQLGLKYESRLDGEDIVTYLMSCTLGRMDDVVRLVRAAACYAITTREERITVDLLKQAQKAPWSYSRFT